MAFAYTLNLRTNVFDSMTVVAPLGGLTAGDLVQVGNVIGLVVESALAGAPAVLIYRCAKVLLPKAQGVITAGAALYFDAGNKRVTTDAQAAYTPCGAATDAAGVNDLEVEADLQGVYVAAGDVSALEESVAALRTITGDGTMRSEVECVGVTAGKELYVFMNTAADDLTVLTAVDSRTPGANEFDIGSPPSNRACAESLRLALNAISGVEGSLPVSPSAKVTAKASTMLLFETDDPDVFVIENGTNLFPDTNLLDATTLLSCNNSAQIGSPDDDLSMDTLFGTTGILRIAASDVATVTIDAAVDTNALTLNGVTETFGVGGIGAAVVAGTAPEKDHANALLMAAALREHNDVLSAEVALGVVTVTSKPNRALLFTSVTATRIVVADTSPDYSIAKQLRTLIQAT